MADLSKAQQKRAEARRRRRDQAEDPQPEPEPESVPSDGQDAHHGMLQAAKVAAAAGAAGAAVAAARALTAHDDAEAPTAEAEPTDQPEQEEPEPQATKEPAEEPQSVEEPQASEEAEPEREREPEPREEPPPVAGAAQSDARRALDRAREQLEDLLGRPVEKVSSLERTHDGWVLALEVVELQRIPETTDVLASYEMELDDDLNLRRYQQARRYHRGHADNGDGR